MSKKLIASVKAKGEQRQSVIDVITKQGTQAEVNEVFQQLFGQRPARQEGTNQGTSNNPFGFQRGNTGPPPVRRAAPGPQNRFP